jgi:hypothetical protein
MPTATVRCFSSPSTRMAGIAACEVVLALRRVRAKLMKMRIMQTNELCGLIKSRPGRAL